MQTEEMLTSQNNEASAEMSVEKGTVHSCTQGHYVVQSSVGLLPARRAFSCLVEPEAEDRVMISLDEKGESLILAILERPNGNKTVMAFPGDVTLAIPQGQVSLCTRDGLDLATAGEIGMVASSINMTGDQGQLNISKLSAVGDEFTGNMKRIRVFAETLETVATRLSQRVKTYFRWVEELEEVKAGQMIQTSVTSFPCVRVSLRLQRLRTLKLMQNVSTWVKRQNELPRSKRRGIK